LGGHSKLELVVGDFEEGKEFPDEDADVLLVDECVRKFECSAPD
jgi:hypothetical protein